MSRPVSIYPDPCARGGTRTASRGAARPLAGGGRPQPAGAADRGLAEAVAEHGYNAVTIAHITKAARVSRRAFYENFENKEECFLAAFEIVVGHVRTSSPRRSGQTDDWPHEVIAAFRAALGFLAEEPDLARLCLVESLTAGPSSPSASSRPSTASPAARARAAVRESDRELPESTESSLIGALVTLASRSIIAGEADRLDRLLPDFVEFSLTPYVGAGWKVS